MGIASCRGHADLPSQGSSSAARRATSSSARSAFPDRIVQTDTRTGGRLPGHAGCRRAPRILERRRGGAGLDRATFVAQRQVQARRQRTRLQQQLVQLVPPELAIRAQRAARQEESGRHSLADQQRRRRVQVVGIAVVERDGHARARAVTAARSDELAQRHHSKVFRQHLELRNEVRRRHAEAPRIDEIGRDPVVHEHDAGRPAAPRQPAGQCPQSPHDVHNGRVILAVITQRIQFVAMIELGRRKFLGRHALQETDAREHVAVLHEFDGHRPGTPPPAGDAATMP